MEQLLTKKGLMKVVRRDPCWINITPTSFEIAELLSNCHFDYSIDIAPGVLESVTEEILDPNNKEMRQRLKEIVARNLVRIDDEQYQDLMQSQTEDFEREFKDIFASRIKDSQREIIDLQNKIKNTHYTAIEDSITDSLQNIEIKLVLENATEQDIRLIKSVKEELKKNTQCHIQDSSKHARSRLENKTYILNLILDRTQGACGNRNITPEEIAEKLVEQGIEKGKDSLKDEKTRQYLNQKLETFLIESRLLKRVNTCPPCYQIDTEMAFRLIIDEIQEHGINTAPLTARWAYVWNNKHSLQRHLNPSKIRDECIMDYIEYCATKIDPTKNKDTKRLELAKRVFAQDKKLVLDEYLSALSKTTRKRLKAEFKKKLKKPYSRIRGKKKRIIENVVLEELGIFLQSKEADNQKGNLELVLKKWKPKIYEKHIGLLSKLSIPISKPSYSLEISRDPIEVKRAAKATRLSCIKNRTLKQFAKELSDPSTIYFVAKKNSRVRGYARMFLMENENKEPVLALDTIEPPGKEFRLHTGLVNAMCLGAIQLGLDLGVKYVVAKDSRIKFGPKEAFGKKTKTMDFKKLGRYPLTAYTIGPYNDKEVYILMQNWKYRKTENEKTAIQDN